MDDSEEEIGNPQPTHNPRTLKNQVKPVVLHIGHSGSIQAKKKEKDQLRIGISTIQSESRATPRNISPKPKESSPKQTIVATAKVIKPSSPG